MTAHSVESKSFLLGDNVFETGYINAGAGASVKAGTLLKRDSVAGKFTSAANAGEAVAVLAVNITNTDSSAKDMSCRVCISGKVRADMLSVNGVTGASDAINDALRSYGIIAIKMIDVSHLDNM